MSLKIYSTVDKLVARDQRIVQQVGDTDGVIASYYDLSGNPSLFLDGTTARLGNVGIKTTTPNEALTVVGNISATNNMYVDGYYYGDGSHLINLPTSNPFNQSLNTTNNVIFSSLSLTDDLTAHNTTIIGGLSCTGRIYASDIHAPLSVSDLTTTTKTLALSDVNSIVTGSSTSDMTITIPLNSTVPFPVGTEIKFIQLGTKKITINRVSGVNLANNSNHYKTKGQHAVTWLFQVTPDQWIFAGDTSP